MNAIIGIVVLMVCVFGGFIMAGGSMKPIIKAAPVETFIILGAGIGGMLIGNSMDIFKGALGGMGKVFKGPAYKKEDYLSTIFVVSKIMKTLKTEGPVALEAHIENPESSAIFGEYPKILHDHALLDLVCNTVRLMVVSTSPLSPYAVEDVMDLSIKTHHHDALKAQTALATLAGALPALGIVACVLGVVKTMGAIDQPPPVLGALIGSALVGTLMGVFLAYGMFEPFSGRLTQIINEDAQAFDVIREMIVCNLKGHPQPLVIESARACIAHHNQPSFSEVFDGMRGS